MRYPLDLTAVIDVTKPPYCADNTGRVDCTAVLRQVFDDVLSREIEGVLATEQRLVTERLDLSEYCLGFENRRWKDGYSVIYPEFVPDARFIYFPAGTYLVSDTVTYTLQNLQNRHWSKPFYELTRGIHLVGEDRDTTVIRLADHAKGFEKGSGKPVVSYSNPPLTCEKECSNVSQMNTFSDLTIDCGEGNEGAVALRFVSNNTGNVENVRLKARGGQIGLQLPVATEGVFRNLEIRGFERGIYFSPDTSVCVLDGVDFQEIQSACISAVKSIATILCNVRANGAPLFDEHAKGGTQILLEKCQEMPKLHQICPQDVAFVDDFGAVGDGKTECSGAIQAAFRSGKSTVVFGSGHYLVNRKIYVPKTVKTVDFAFCNLFAGPQLISGELDSLFVINEESDEMLVMKDLYAFEQFYGSFRLICHGAKRDLFMKNLHTQAASMYFNTVEGSRVRLDNCACTTGTYSMDTILARSGYAPVFSKMVPYEFHGQKVLAYNLNPERADLEVFNDGSLLTVYGLKVEGPGTAVKTVNGGKTEIYGFSAGIGNAKAENALIFDDATSETKLLGGKAFWGYQCVYEKNGQRYMTEGIDPLFFDIEHDKIMRKGV